MSNGENKMHLLSVYMCVCGYSPLRVLNAGTNYSLLIERWETTTKDSNTTTTTSQSSLYDGPEFNFNTNVTPERWNLMNFLY